MMLKYARMKLTCGVTAEDAAAFQVRYKLTVGRVWHHKHRLPSVQPVIIARQKTWNKLRYILFCTFILLQITNCCVS